MGSYVPNTPAEQQAMLREAGYKDFQDLFSCIPQDLLLNRMLDLPEGKSELEVSRMMEEMADPSSPFLLTEPKEVSLHMQNMRALLKKLFDKYLPALEEEDAFHYSDG